MYSLLTLLLPFLMEAQQPSLILPVGHAGIVRSARFSHDGKWVITGGADRVARIWQTDGGKIIQSFTGSKAEIYDAFFSPDTKLAAIITDSAVYLWSVAGAQLISEFPGAYDALFSPDSKRLFLKSLNGAVTQVVVNTGKEERIYEGNLELPLHINRQMSTAAVSDDSRLLVKAGKNYLAFYDISKGNLLTQVQTDADVRQCFFTYGGRYLIVVTEKSIKKIDYKNNFTASDFGESEVPAKVWISPNRKFLLTGEGTDYYNVGVKFWNTETGKDITDELNGKSIYDTTLMMEADGTTRVITGTLKKAFPVIPLVLGNNAFISDDGNYIFTGNFIWHHNNPDSSVRLPVSDFNRLRNTSFSPDAKQLLVQDEEGEVIVWDVNQNKPAEYLTTKTDILTVAELSPDGTKLVITGNDHKAKIINTGTGKNEVILRGHHDKISSVVFSPDGKKILTNSLDSTAILWDAATGEALTVYKGHHPDINPVFFASDKLVLKQAIYDSIPVYNILDPDKIDRYVMEPQVLSYRQQPENFQSSSGRYAFGRTPDGNYALYDDKGINSTTFSFSFSAINAFSTNEKWLAFADQLIDTLLVWDLDKKKMVFSGKLGVVPRTVTGSAGLNRLQFSPDSKFLLCLDVNDLVHWISTGDFNTVSQQTGSYISFSRNDKYFTVVNKGIAEIFEQQSRHLLYTVISVDSNNLLIVDKGYRYDGTTPARQLLYYSCGNELIDLQQAKDQLWVPNLAERIMKGDSINAKTLSELNICAFTPEVEYKSTSGQFRFDIKPRRGGLGETVLFINGIEARRYKPAQLTKTANGYELLVAKKELSAYFIAGKENPVTVKAYTADNSISSRGIIINEDKTGEKETTRPNLYAVMVGVSDYKGEKLDLKYAAKDANDIASVVAVSAKKLLNTDGKEHVYIYDLTTGEKHYRLPEKKSIKITLEEIGTKATANDILMIFFAGHGVMAGEKKQFYFLTADASDAAGTGAVSEVGINTAELTEWMKPQNIRAQKRILIFDACNSGQAIRDLVKVGNEGQGYIAARSDEQSQQIKAIDKLNEQSGFFILSASASNQSAYEMGRYSQGLLTYSLLKAIKQQPDILEQGKYLDVSRWFSAAEKTVTEITKENGARQQPQLISNTNFNIGIVDEEVMAGIILPEQKPVFTTSIFINSDETIGDDDLELSMMINRKLADISSRGTDGNIVYLTGSSLPDAWSLTGRYEIKGNTVTVKVNLKQQKEIKYRFEITGTKDKIAELAAAIVTKASSFVQ